MDIEGIRKMYDNVQLRVSALEAMGVLCEQYAIVLNRVLLRFLPDDLNVPAGG